MPSIIEKELQNIELITYDDMKLLNVSDDTIKDWELTKATLVKVNLPADSMFETEMQNNGYLYADRTVDASINLSKTNLDFKKLIRMEILETAEHKEEILNLAVNAFTYDRRFHIKPQCDVNVSKRVLKKWVEELDEVLVCFYKNTLIGFLALKETEADTLFIHLAAVDEKYRLTGAAMSLYARAIQYSLEKGYKKLNGRISTRNTAVMNLYSYFGAAFSNPTDIFLKEVM